MPSLTTVKSEHHIPVLRELVTRYLITTPGGVYIDGTVGFGGHALHLLDRLEAKAVYLAIDQDEEALHSAQARLANFKNVRYYHKNFSEMREIITELNIDHVCLQKT